MLHMLAYYVMPTFSKERVNASFIHLDIATRLNLPSLACRVTGGADCILQPVAVHMPMEL